MMIPYEEALHETLLSWLDLTGFGVIIIHMYSSFNVLIIFSRCKFHVLIIVSSRKNFTAIRIFVLQYFLFIL